MLGSPCKKSEGACEEAFVAGERVRMRIPSHVYIVKAHLMWASVMSLAISHTPSAHTNGENEASLTVFVNVLKQLVEGSITFHLFILLLFFNLDTIMEKRKR